MPISSSLGQSLGSALGQFAFGGDTRKSDLKGMLDGARAGAYDANRQQSLAQALKAQAEADQFTAQNESRKPQAVLRNAMTNFGIPQNEAQAVEQFIKTGRLGGGYDVAADGMGPVMPPPLWSGKLPDVGRAVSDINNALTIGDKSSKSIAEASASNRESRLKDQIIAGTLDPTRMAQAEYAGKGNAPFKFDEYGVGNNLTGTLDDSTGPAARFGQKRTAEALADKARATASYASAGASNALADQRKAVTQAGGGGGKPPVGYRYTATEDGEVTLEPIPGGPKDPKNIQPKPMPSTALKMQQEELDAIGTAASTDADLGAIVTQINEGKLSLGPISNVTGQVRNMAGMSTKESRNLATFKATLEKLRNDSLRLNKGVQTEGDSQRAWNEVLTNINDPEVVKQRLGEVQAINRRAADLRKLNIETLRANFGQPPLDVGGQTNVKPAVGGSGIPSMSAIDAEIARRRGGK